MRHFAWVIAVFSLLAGGCASSQITSLTATRQPRNASGVYPIEFAWDSGQQTIIAGTLKPYVVVGFDTYPMRSALGISNRWETVVPVSADKNYIIYHFKVDYEYRTFGHPEKSSKRSPSYRLDIIEK